MTPGIHLLHKPPGPTSFSIVQNCLKSAAADKSRKPPKICHGGTLDPFAEGLLLILVEPATRLFDYLHAIPKVYEATVRWGIETDNGDPLGAVVSNGDPSNLNEQQLEDALRTFIGWQEQIPHPTSAKRIGGERAYVKAHRGDVFDMPPARVYLHEAAWLNHELPLQSKLRITVRGGYYVRALARDLGRALGCGAHLASLRRSSIGPWQDPGPEKTVTLHGHDILPWTNWRDLTDQEVGDVRHEKTIPLEPLSPPDWPLPAGFPDPEAPIRAFHLGKLCFLLQPHEGGLRLLTPLRGGL